MALTNVSSQYQPKMPTFAMLSIIAVYRALDWHHFEPHQLLGVGRVKLPSRFYFLAPVWEILYGGLL
jgi:hypothetical protein